MYLTLPNEIIKLEAKTSFASKTWVDNQGYKDEAGRTGARFVGLSDIRARLEGSSLLEQTIRS